MYGCHTLSLYRDIGQSKNVIILRKHEQNIVCDQHVYSNNSSSVEANFFPISTFSQRQTRHSFGHLDSILKTQHAH